ncbi:MAG: VWA domain-containing protein [Planctomycetota bacterium]
MIGFELLAPAQAWTFGLVALVWLVTWRGRRASQREVRALVDAWRLSAFLPGYSPGRQRLRHAASLAALALLAFASLGPVRGWTEREVLEKGLDLVVCVDTSRSMLAEDLRPNRLERARREVRGLIDLLRGDRMALIAFSGDAREIAPLTRDRTTLVGFLEAMDVADNRKGGTDLAVALEAALGLFDGRSGAHEAIVVLTDGEDLSGRGLEVAKIAEERGIRVFVVGIGTEGGGKIPVVGPDGSTQFVVGPGGDEVVTRLDGTTLERLAERTNGAYLSTENAALPLETLFRSRITRLEGRENSGGTRKVPHDRYQWFGLLGLACLGLELFLGERRGGRE